MRGKGRRPDCEQGAVRITPAYAGKRLPLRVAWVRHKDHPRVCGEKFIPAPIAFVLMGSPPRMRGKGGKNHRSVLQSRITPAYAGKSDGVIHDF